MSQWIYSDYLHILIRISKYGLPSKCVDTSVSRITKKTRKLQIYRNLQWGKWLNKTHSEIFGSTFKVPGVNVGILDRLSFFLHVCDAENQFVLFQALIDLGMLNCLRLRKRPSKKQYKRLNDTLLSSPSWPPLGRPLPSTSHSVIHIS